MEDKALQDRAWIKLEYLLVYNSVVLFVFYLINSMLKDSDFNFANGADIKDRNSSLMYYTLNVHSTVGFGDITPTSRLARFVFALHLFFSFIGNAFILLFF